MKRLHSVTITGVILVSFLPTVGGVGAQGLPPPPSPISELRLDLVPLGESSLTWKDNSADETHFDVRFWIDFIPTYAVGVVSAGTTSIDLTPFAPWLFVPGCHEVTAWVFPVRGDVAQGFVPVVRRPYCTDGEHIFDWDGSSGPRAFGLDDVRDRSALLPPLPAPKVLAPPVTPPVPPPPPQVAPAVSGPPPAAASDVRVVRDDLGGWRIEWRDNSTDETGFDVGLWLVDHTGFGLAVVPANTTSLVVPDPLPTDYPAGCYTTRVLVFSFREQSASGLPANTELPMCFNARRTLFPATGAPSERRSPVTSTAVPGLLVAGLLLVLFGVCWSRVGTRSCAPNVPPDLRSLISDAVPCSLRMRKMLRRVRP